MRYTLRSLAPTKLFADHNLADRIDSYHRDSQRAVDVADLSELSPEAINGKTDDLVTEHALAPLTVCAEQRTKGHRHVVIEDEDGGGSRDLIQVIIPFDGPAPLLYCIPSTPASDEFHADVSGRSIILEFDSSEDPQTITMKVDQRLKVLNAWVTAVNTDLERGRARMHADVLDGLRARVTNRQQAMTALAALEIPTTKVPPERAVEIPAKPRSVRLPPNDRGGDSSWVLADDTYERVIDTIVRFAHAMERRAVSANKLIPDEETLRDWIVFVLNSTYERDGGDDLFVTGETLNGSGKTDILVHQGARNVFIGECKVWNGPASVDKGIDQILGYLGWRDVKAALLLFIKDAEPSRVIRAAEQQIENHLNYQSTTSMHENLDRRDYLMSSKRDPDVTVRLALIPVVVTVADRS